ncbi:hypothetical protein [Rhodococcus sp. Q1]|uniref:hypothetical protein n=1 Tax=Rhodococcus sp. Q1 TaxID=2508718 RepID=UPI0010203F3D|nr:hypothetical protein [Rhodococcus sp. Q1]
MTWNASRAEATQTVLVPWRWEDNAVPLLGAAPQNIINTQAVDSCDIVVAVFDSRLGTATDAAVSGTAEEIMRAADAGKPVHVWFSSEAIPRDADLDQLQRLRDFQAQLQTQGLLGAYTGTDDLMFQVRNALEHDLESLRLGKVTIANLNQSAQVRGRIDKQREQSGVDKTGAPKFTNRYKMVVENLSDTVTAENLTVHFGEFTENMLNSEEAAHAFDLIPRSDFAWPMWVASGTASAATVSFEWEENGENKSIEQRIALP